MNGPGVGYKRRFGIRQNVFMGVVLFCITFSAHSKEAYVDLGAYVSGAEAICICSVEKDNGDGTVTANVMNVLKGALPASIVIRGQTGHCVLAGPVSRFMKAGNKYLVFLFENNTVGRLGGILEIDEDRRIVIQFTAGLAGTELDKDGFRRRLPLDEAVKQIEQLQESLARAEDLKRRVDSVSVTIRYHGPQDKPYYNLWLLTGVLPPVSLLPNWLTASEIEKDQMVRIIDRLAKKGFFVDPRPVEAKGPEYAGPAYSVRVQYEKGYYQGSVGWGPPMLRFLNELGDLLQGAPREQMRKLLGRLAGHQEQWARTVQDIRKLAGKSELIVVGRVTNVYDSTGRDAGVGYDVDIDRVIKGDCANRTIRFRSGGWIGYTGYKSGEDVLLFLYRTSGEARELLQHKPVIHLTQPGDVLRGSVSKFWEVECCLNALISAGRGVSEAGSAVGSNRQTRQTTWGQELRGPRCKIRVETGVYWVGEPVPVILTDIGDWIGTVRSSFQEGVVIACEQPQ